MWRFLWITIKLEFAEIHILQLVKPSVDQSEKLVKSVKRMLIKKKFLRENARYITKRIFFAGYSIDTGYVTKINLKTWKTPHVSQREPSQNPPMLLYHSLVQKLGRANWEEHFSSLDKPSTYQYWMGETISKITTLLYLDLYF